MPADKLEALQKQADDKQKAWKRMQEDSQKDLQEAERKEMAAALESRIGPIVKEYFRERHYSLVLDTRAGIHVRGRSHQCDRRGLEAHQHERGLAAGEAGPRIAASKVPTRAGPETARRAARKADPAPKNPRKAAPRP